MTATLEKSKFFKDSGLSYLEQQEFERQRKIVFRKVAEVIHNMVPIFKYDVRQFKLASDGKFEEDARYCPNQTSLEIRNEGKNMKILQRGWEKITKEIAAIKDFDKYFQRIKNPIEMIGRGENDSPDISKAVAYCDDLLFVFRPVDTK